MNFVFLQSKTNDVSLAIDGQRERERELSLHNLPVYLDEICQALGDVIKQLCTGTNHNTLWDGVDL